MKKIIGAVALASCIVGCATATRGKDFDETAATRFVAGATTMDEAKEALGPPQQIMRNTEGRTKLVWKYSRGMATLGSVKGESKLLGVVFDEKGKFLRVSDEINSK